MADAKIASRKDIFFMRGLNNICWRTLGSNYHEIVPKIKFFVVGRSPRDSSAPGLRPTFFRVFDLADFFAYHHKEVCMK
jgi:hypothetical protein